MQLPFYLNCREIPKFLPSMYTLMNRPLLKHPKNMSMNGQSQREKNNEFAPATSFVDADHHGCDA